MKAARYHPDTAKVTVDEVPLPKIKDDEILVKMGSASLCHSDLMLIEGSIPSDGNPVTLGHEGVGFIEDMGKDVKGFSQGDRIGFLYIKGCCFKCRGCQVHNLNCETGGAHLMGFQTDGMFAEYAAIAWQNAILLPESLPTDSSAPIFCAGITAFYAVDECGMKPGDWFVAVGCGGLGQLAIAYARAMGFKTIGLDINDKTLELSGADYTFNTMTNKDYVAEVKNVTDGGADAAAVFSAALPAYESAKQVLHVMGSLMVIGLPSKPLTFDALDLMKSLYVIKSTSTGPPHKMPRAVEFTAKHNILSKVEKYKLDEINSMIDKMKNGQSTGRMAIVF